MDLKKLLEEALPYLEELYEDLEDWKYTDKKHGDRDSAARRAENQRQVRTFMRKIRRAIKEAHNE
jgi:hypothetical protein